ncbi:MAG: FAD:protein FMN transferase [Desulfobulbaceae bacterium]|nr:FAD:protein FMN transferase [Desulfobulbaceae bacterium]
MKQNQDNSPRIGRRRFLQIIAAAGATGALWQLGLRKKILQSRIVRQSRAMMGTQINLVVHGPDRDACEEAVQAVFSRMENLIGSFSRHSPESELSLLNRTGSLKNPGRDLQQVLLLSEQVSRKTEGSFDISVLPLLNLYKTRLADGSMPAEEELRQTLRLVDYRKITIGPEAIILAENGMGITLDGIGKGYIVDQGIATLQSRGFTSVYVEAGGDLMVTGAKEGDRSWRIGIRNPRPGTSDKLIAVDITNRAVATSGDYMQPFTPDLRYHHIIDPRTGISPPELASATVTAPTVAMADALATAAMVLGPDKSLALLESIPDCEGYFISKDLHPFRTSGFSARHEKFSS